MAHRLQSRKQRCDVSTDRHSDFREEAERQVGTMQQDVTHRQPRVKASGVAEHGDSTIVKSTTQDPLPIQQKDAKEMVVVGSIRTDESKESSPERVVPEDAKERSGHEEARGEGETDEDAKELSAIREICVEKETDEKTHAVKYTEAETRADENTVQMPMEHNEAPTKRTPLRKSKKRKRT